MKKYIIKQLIMIIPTLLIVTLISFLLIRLLPSDAVDTFLTAHHLKRTDENIALVKNQLGLDKPLPLQYLIWLKNALVFDFGKSYTSTQTVSEMIGPAFVSTLQLALFSMIWIVGLTLLLGLLSAKKPGSAGDHFVRFFSMFGTAVPSFVLGYFLIRIFAVQLKILPVSGKSSLLNFLMPSFCLALLHVVYFIKMIRNGMIEQRQSPYVLYAKVRGVPEKRIFNTHVLKNSLLPVVNTLGISIGRLIAGTVIVENVFAWPGLGRLITRAILSRDYPVIQGYILLIALVFCLTNILSDIFSAIIDPRIRLGEKK